MNPDLVQFNSWPMHNRVLLLESDAAFISYFLTPESTTSLYFYDNYFIEMVVDHNTNNLIEVVAFKDTKRLYKYLSDVALDELTKKPDEC